MKKLIYTLAAVIMCTSFIGCNNQNNDNTQTEDSAVNSDSISYTQNDFALYSADENLQPSKFLSMLGIDPETVKYTDDEAIYASQFLETNTLKVPTSDPEKPWETTELTQINYVSYTGSHTPVINVKGISTTGAVKEDDYCSKVEDVIKAYGIDTEKEEYIDEKTDDKNYTIKLYFTATSNSDNIERIITPAGTEVNVEKAKYSMRFTITNDYVHGIEYYMYY